MYEYAEDNIWLVGLKFIPKPKPQTILPLTITTVLTVTTTTTIRTDWLTDTLTDSHTTQKTHANSSHKHADTLL